MSDALPKPVAWTRIHPRMFRTAKAIRDHEAHLWQPLFTAEQVAELMADLVENRKGLDRLREFRAAYCKANG